MTNGFLPVSIDGVKKPWPSHQSYQRASTAFGSVLLSYLPRVLLTDLATCLPAYVVAAIREALPVFGRQIAGFDMADAVMTGVETRTSSPVRLPRGADLQSSNTPGLFPAGEGCGYAGGILSAGVDGIRVAEAVARSVIGREPVASWVMMLPGGHNAMNAATACALATMLGADPQLVAASLGAFRGVDRRTQFLGERACPMGGSVRVYDDYGHHPTEIEATLKALRDFERPYERGGKLVCVFQPHQHSRTRHLMEEFANAFSSADVVIVPHIYFVRDSQEERQKVTAADLVDRLRQRGVRAMHLYPFEAIVEQLENVCGPGDLLVVMGAGPVWQVAHGYLKPSDSVAAVA